jgi:hypothetical protein
MEVIRLRDEGLIYEEGLLRPTEDCFRFKCGKCIYRKRF